jgi:hypothetical protein
MLKRLLPSPKRASIILSIAYVRWAIGWMISLGNF